MYIFMKGFVLFSRGVKIHFGSSNQLDLVKTAKIVKIKPEKAPICKPLVKVFQCFIIKTIIISGL